MIYLYSSAHRNEYFIKDADDWRTFSVANINELLVLIIQDNNQIDSFITGGKFDSTFDPWYSIKTYNSIEDLIEDNIQEIL